MLSQQRVLLLLSGGIALYKSCMLVRLLTTAGARVQVLMSHAAQDLIHPSTFAALSGRAVITDWQNAAPYNHRNMPHIDASRDADIIVVAPASSNTIAKTVHGIADNLLSSTLLARPQNISLLMAPAMNVEMWQAVATQNNIKLAQQQGINLVGPKEGIQACGEEGPGRMAEPEEIMHAITALLTPNILKNKHIVITAGATYEPIDPVRGITNRSSGKMGYAIARAAQLSGARVTLISGVCHLPVPYGVSHISCEQAQEMFAAVKKVLPTADVYIGVAAVADWRAQNMSTQKFSKTNHSLQDVQWQENPDILAYVAQHSDKIFSVGFCAETADNEGDLLAKATAKRQRKKVDVMCANYASAIASDHNKLWLIGDADQPVVLDMADKNVIAQQLIAYIAKSL